jgi:hypothetical protein
MWELLFRGNNYCPLETFLSRVGVMYAAQVVGVVSDFVCNLQTMNCYQQRYVIVFGGSYETAEKYGFDYLHVLDIGKCYQDQ